MLRFTIHPSRDRRVKFDAARGYLLGAHDMAVKGRIKVGDGILECETTSSKAAAINLECETKEMGRLALSTCLLEQRDEPYLLLLELARHRIKQFIAKAEDWQIWDHPAAKEALEQWNRARDHFTSAMTSADPAQADHESALALITGLKASERLAVAHSRILMHRRFGSRAASKLVLGVKLDPGITPSRATGAQGEADQFAQFDMVSLPLPWSKIERAPGVYDTSVLGPWIEWAQAHSRTVMAGPLIDLRPANLPPWLVAKRGDFAALRDGVWKFAEAVGDAIAGHVRMWDIASGLNDGEWWTLKIEQMVELARRAEVGLRKARKEVPTLVEIEHPFGHDVALREGAIAPRAFVEALVNDGVHVDCLMVKLLMGEPGSGHLTRDLLEVSAMLDAYIPYRKPVFVEIGAPSALIDQQAGHWRAPWTPKSQSVWASRIFAIAMSKPHVELVLWHALQDSDASAPPHGLVGIDRAVKPVAAALATIRNTLRKPLGVWKPVVQKGPSGAHAHDGGSRGA